MTANPLHSPVSKQRSMFSGRLLSQTCSTDRLWRHCVLLYDAMPNRWGGVRETCVFKSVCTTLPPYDFTFSLSVLIICNLHF